MTPNLPQRLWRPLSEVKSFVERFPNGVKLADVKNKVGAFKTLKTKEQSELLEFLQSRESILVLDCKAPTAKRVTQFLRHKKYGWPKSIPGYIFPLPRRPLPAINVTSIEAKKIKEQFMTYKSPEQLRKQAEALIKEAEEAERKANDSDLFNKKLQPVRLELLQAIAGVQKLFDQQMDAMGTLEKAAAKLRNLTA
ncbi:hypothetical protein ACLMPM_22720 [Yersinia enterocolitica]|uniref:hypothetical protein n=1 Tax=Yersinia enterocolitica TaxID=630 RepID=UPI00398D3C08